MPVPRRASKESGAKTPGGPDGARSPRISKSAPTPSSPESEFVHGARPSESKTLEASIGEQVRVLRKKSGVTVMELSNQSGVSISMLSKIENGGTSPSLATLQSLAEALNVPISIFFTKFDEKRDASFVKSGHGLLIERRGTKSGHQYRLLGHSVAGDIAVEPYLITLTDEADPYPVFQHEGVEFIHMLKGEVDYRHADKTYPLRKGDSLFFDAAAPHGPEVLGKLPAEYLSIIIYPRE